MTYLKYLSTFLIGILLGITLIQVTSASSIYSSGIGFLAGNRGYRARAQIVLSIIPSTNEHIAWGLGDINPTDNMNVSAGMMGAKGTLYRYQSNNTHILIGSSSLLFNKSATNTHSVGVDTVAVKNWSYNAVGYLEAWNSTTGRYVAQTSNRTPNLTH